MAECSSCGAELAPHEARCPTCGKTTPLYHRQRRCLHCGTPVAEQTQVCMICHQPIEGLPLDHSLFSGSWRGIGLGVVIIVFIVMTVLGYQNNGAATAQVGPTLTATPATTRPPTRAATPTPTITSSSTPSPTETVVLTPIVHVIESGQTLGLIAPLYDMTPEEIAAANGIGLNTILSVGQELIIPGEATPLPEATPTPVLAPYVIQEGDLISSVAFQNGTTVDAIRAANPGTNLEMIFPGQEIFVPVATPTPTGTPTPLPTATSTPLPFYPAPNLLMPINGQTIEADTLLFNWTSTTLLAEDEYYVIEVTWSNGQTSEYWVKSNSLRLPTAERPVSGQVSWRVMIKRQTGTTAQGQRLGETLSPVAEPYSFEWR
ncbi:MAG TPA: LysM peptidoglycan-binding domain-containing protein [Anaerolineae bacterium]|nr:LysM peptidoglycan-binding domain-containing protein [Anaerolineae bacterium]